ncbi:MATE family efflux transporter, partial [Atopobium minutum]|uniref:MATE family efflux transporter n=1 Tax=Atopobium minutum TaxID=1381 RepID=UPI00280A6B76
MSTNHDKLFTQTPLYKMLLIIVVPGAISMLTSALYDIIDGIMVGNLLGETAFAAINLAMPFVIILFSIGDLIGVGSAVPLSITLGEKDHEAANNIFSYSIVMLFISGLGIGLLVFFAAPFLIALQGASGKLAEISIIYLRIYALFIPISGMMFAMDNYLKVCGKVGRSMALNILMAVSGAILEAILLIVFHTEVWGAAFAYSLAMVIASTIGLWPFIRGKMVLKLVRPKPTLALTKQIVMAGLSAFLNNVAGRVVSIVLNARMLLLGGEQAVSIFGIMMFTDAFVMSLIYGTTDSLQPSIGYNWGAKNYKRAFEIGKSSFIISPVFSVIYIILLHLLPEVP